MHRAKHLRAPTSLVVFGATGDLMARKIVPALAFLFGAGLLPEPFAVVGFSRREWDDVRFRDHIAGLLDASPGQLANVSRERFLGMFTHRAGTFEDASAYAGIAQDLEELDERWAACSNKLFYLAVPPEYYETIFSRLAASGLTEKCSAEEGWTRVLVEKPFGRDAKTARRLDVLLGSLFREEQIYRIDHYLAKEMLRGIVDFRFYNDVFRAGWSGHFIESVDIRLLETLDVGKRGQFYDGVGALRDVGQNHLLQVLAMVAMRQPDTLSASAIRDRRAEVLRSLPEFDGGAAALSTYRAQYDGYRDVPDVAADSATETYFKLETGIDLAGWEGVRFSLETGKGLAEARKEVVVTFRHPRPCLCPPGKHYRNQVIFTLEPEPRIRVVFWAKRPGFANELTRQAFEFLPEEQAEEQGVEPYAKLLLDCVRGDQTLFVSTAEVDAMWRFIDPIEDAWRVGEPPVGTYALGTDEVRDRADEVLRGRRISHEIGIVGLGKMGANLALNLVDHDWRVVGYDRSNSATKSYEPRGVEGAHTVRDLVASLKPPRVVWLMVPAGDPTEQALFGVGGLADMLEPGDAVIDGGNSFFGDDPARAERLRARGIDFVDVGTSGGPTGARHGACLMIGGRRDTYDRLEPLWRAVSVEGGHDFFGDVGAGHYVKMIHNGIEYGMMQSLAEGFAVMRQSPYDLPLKKVASVYDHGSVIESRFVGWLRQAFEEHGERMDGVSGTVARGGEGAWTVDDAHRVGVPVPAIEAAFRFRVDSDAHPSYAGQLLQAIRNRFGGHPLAAAKTEEKQATLV